MEQSYKEKYEDILARLERAKNDNDVCDERFCCVINDIIPELAESEEEKIKKRTTLCLEECVHSDVIRDYEKDECVAWLEKQGQVKESHISQHENKTCEENGNSLTSEDEKVRKALLEMVHDTTGDELLVDYNVHKEEALDWLEKQKPADKVEPKFHEGEWITNGDYIWKILEVRPLDYTLLSQDDNIVDDTISHVDEQFHSFTIADAKDGDVLCLYYNNRKTFFIFKAIIGEGDYADILVHCCYTGKYQYLEPSFNGECRMHQISDGGYCLPADKEEQDILFQKMKEAGYEWDAENKKLKKIEQKPSWSEEEEAVLDALIRRLEGEDIHVSPHLAAECLKSLKERIGGKV